MIMALCLVIPLRVCYDMIPSEDSGTKLLKCVFSGKNGDEKQEKHFFREKLSFLQQTAHFHCGELLNLE